MIIVHLTSKLNWQKIRESGYLKSKKSLDPEAKGQDADRIFAFKIKNMEVLLIKEMKIFFATQKSIPINILLPEDVVLLSIAQHPEYEWVLETQYKFKNELAKNSERYSSELLEIVSLYWHCKKDVPLHLISEIK